MTLNSLEAGENTGDELVTVRGPFTEEETLGIQQLDAPTMAIADEGEVVGAEVSVGWVAIANE